MVRKTVHKLKGFRPTRKHGSKRVALYICVFAAIGGIAVVLTHAATSTGAFEPEAGSKSSSVSIGSDQNASGQSYVKFNPAAQGGAQYQTAFDTANDFYNNFDYGYGGFPAPGDANRPDSWLADHDLSCGGDGTYRTAHFGLTRDDPHESFYWCSGHMHMTYFSYGFGTLWMSPKAYFSNIKKVCSDLSLTWLGGRESFNMIITNQSDIDLADARVNRFDLSFSPPGYQDLSGQNSTSGVVGTTDTAGIKYYGGGLTYWRGPDDLHGIEGNDYKPEDRTMGRLCGTDNGNGTIALTQQRPTGTVTATISGSFPTGNQQRVVWEVLAHNPSKDIEYDPNQNTYHIDNILIQ